ncbi:fibronectin type III domain-containing protein [Nocardioides mangrovi]|uniref:Fibronectin type III domain-containing protein n=1 Tax=Nocardioides mangrovi TaxID=2874580 RepID=A0ABS7U7V7_9ACTN|nr:fibronectin type III domain-containing protein [Nocardioides mangrovi]MBZ5736907.1 fibronectin type III domain-containing protein [Nocardioides mangrovi]
MRSQILLRAGAVVASVAVVVGVSGDGSASVRSADPPSVPFNVQARAKGDLGADVLWAHPTTNHGSEVTSFTITASPGGVSTTVPADAERAHVDGLTAGVATSFTVVATSAAGDSKASAASNDVVPAHLPMVPAQVTAEARHDATVAVSWRPGVPDWDPAAEQALVTGYEITATPVNGVGVGDGPRVGAAAPPGATSALVEGVRRGVEYALTIRAVNRVGESGDSAPVQVTVPSTIPGRVPGAVGAMVVGSRPHHRSIVSVWWYVPEDGGASIMRYVVTIKTNRTSVVKRVSGAKHQARLVLGPGKYLFRVAAVNVNGKGRASTRKVLRVP